MNTFSISFHAVPSKTAFAYAHIVHIVDAESFGAALDKAQAALALDGYSQAECIGYFDMGSASRFVH